MRVIIEGLGESNNYHKDIIRLKQQSRDLEKLTGFKFDKTEYQRNLMEKSAQKTIAIDRKRKDDDIGISHLLTHDIAYE